MKTLKLLVLVGAAAVTLSGCAVYGPPPGAVYAAPAPYYAPPPVYYGPSVGIGVYGGYGRGYGYGHRGWR